MATLQKIRNKGKILIVIVGLALFAFIAEEFVRSLSYTQSESRQRIGKIYGENVNVQDFNALVDEYTDVIKFSNGFSSLTDEQTSMLRDQVWQTYVSQKIIEHEAEKLGLSVTDEELQAIVSNGRSPLLNQTPFKNQKGEFDYNALKQFLSQYSQVINNPEIPGESKEQYVQMFNFWKFIEKSIRQQQLAQKFQSLLGGAVLSNPVAAQLNFDGRANESEILMAAVPYTSIKDADITIEDSELKAKYEEMKEIFRANQEGRDIKYIDVAVKASKEDEAALNEEMNGYAQALAEGAEPAKTVREAASQVAYSAMPISKNALPQDIAEALDSMNVGDQKGPYYFDQDNTMNIIRLIAKVDRPDSIEVRQISVPGADFEAASKRADSIMTVLNAGTEFDSIAKQFDQVGAKNWITSAMYEGQTIDEKNRSFLETLNTATIGVYNKIAFDGQGVVIAQVTDRKNIISKYDVAVIKRSVDFSKDTYGKAYNDFSAFLAGNPTAEEIEANAEKAGYTVLSRQGISNAEHTVANVNSTRETMRWIFNSKTKIGEVSPLYECGDNDHMMVVILTGIHKKGYLPWDDENVKTFLTNEVMKDKKAAQLQDKMKDMKSVEDIAKIEGAQTDTIKHVSFTNNAFVAKFGASEPALSGAVCNAKAGDFKNGIKGNAAVYAFKVLGQTKNDNLKFDQKQEEKQVAQMNSRALAGITAELFQKAEVVDNRYIFY